MKKERPSISGLARRPLSRRQFIRFAGLAGAALGAAGCGTPATPAPTPEPAAAPPSRVPTVTPVATAAPSATSAPVVAATVPAVTTAPTLAPSAVPTTVPTAVPATAVAGTMPEIVKIYPAVPSVVVRTHHAGAWSGTDLVPAALRQMLDASITRLTGLNDARAAWAAIFRPNERIAIKVNTIAGSSIFTHVPLVNAVVDSLVAAGIPAGQILIYDRYQYELQGAGFKLNQNGPGPRCLSTDKVEPGYAGSYKLAGQVDTKLSTLLTDCDALINMPILKQHGMSGLSFALKNHYGTCHNPGALHYAMADVIPALNALPPIRERTRLIIGDVLAYTLQDYWVQFKRSDAIFMSFDPVAHDTIGLQTFVDLKKAAGEKPDAHVARASGWLKNAAKLGLGANATQNIRLEEITLT